MTVQTFRLGYSSVSVFPHNPVNLAEDLYNFGCAGFQFLPMRGTNYQDIRNWERWVLTYENAWNYGSVVQALKRLLKLVGEPAPTFKDLFLFGQERSPSFPDPSIQITHHFQWPPSNRFAVEIRREMTTNKYSYIGYAKLGGALCWDTFHALENWEELLDELPEKCIKALHIHFEDRELFDFMMYPTGGATVTMLRKLVRSGKLGDNIPVVLEFKPNEDSIFMPRRFLEKLFLVTSQVLYHAA